MGICYLMQNGGGASLNFKVIGNPMPSTAKENTIWIDTDVPITSYIFSATQPTGVPGMVWITIGTSSNVEFNALKKNGLQVYPLSAKQYVGGAWNSLDAWTYQNSEWEQFSEAIPYLYNSGDECTNITGGWSAYCPNDGYTIGTLTKNASSIKISASGYRNLIRCETKNVVDLSKYNYVYVNVTAFSGFTEAKIAIASSHTAATFNAYTLITKKGLYKVKVSGINSGIVLIKGFTETDGETGSLTFSEVYAE